MTDLLIGKFLNALIGTRAGISFGLLCHECVRFYLPIVRLAFNQIHADSGDKIPTVRVQHGARHEPIGGRSKGGSSNIAWSPHAMNRQVFPILFKSTFMRVRLATVTLAPAAIPN